ncbi:MAG: L-rhamnose isomerase [Fimbriimonadaceae bacterium]
MRWMQDARRFYEDYGIDVDHVIQTCINVPISIHCWQADDVVGLEAKSDASDSGGILATGGHPGRARSGDEIRADLEWVLDRVPGSHRLNLHAMYAETGATSVPRDELEPDHFSNWIEWAAGQRLGLDFNPTYFAHPYAKEGFTLSSQNRDIQGFWIRHGKACRRIAKAFAEAQNSDCVINHWIPDGAKDNPIDRWAPRARLRSALDEVLSVPIPGVVDAVESKLFGLGSEDYVVGSFEFYAQYASQSNALLCLDMGHFHPTETIHDKLSALLQFQDDLLLHVSRPMRWDSDHVVLFDDNLRAVFAELNRGASLNRVKIALDFFDASINRVAAYVIGIRATRKAMLAALLEPVSQLKQLELEGRFAEKLALLEETKTLPFGAAWNELCDRAGVAGAEWIQDIQAYEANIGGTRG